MLNTAPEDQSWARQALVHYVDTLQSGEHFALYSLGKTLSVIQDFTDDPERLRRAARRATPGASRIRLPMIWRRICWRPPRTWATPSRMGFSKTPS